MYKRSPSTNYRSKGIKVKHILQICVLLAVCLWLIYQVKHSHEKRRQFEAKDEKVVGKILSDGEIQRLGRKDLPRISESAKDGEKHEEDEEEKEGDEEENKHEEDESEREDVQVVEKEDERGGGDDEIDEPEKVEIESEHEEEGEDEDKEREDKEGVTEERHIENEDSEDVHEEGHPEDEENEDAGKDSHTRHDENDDVDNENRIEQEVILDDKDHVGSRTNTRQAQEELYRADDASSEVAQNVQSIIQETENVTADHGNGMWGKVNFGQENETKTSGNADELIKPEVQPREDVDRATSNIIISEQKQKEVNLTKLDENSLQNSELPEITTDSTVGGEHSATLSSNETQAALASTNFPQNGTVEVFGDKEPNLPGNVLEHTVKLELATNDKNQQEATENGNKGNNVNTNAGESLTSHDPSLASSHDTNDRDAIEAAKDILVGKESQGEKQENSESGLDKSSEAHSSEGTDEIQHDPIDASDTTTLIQEERESRKDLGMLPEIRNEIQNNEDAATE